MLEEVRLFLTLLFLLVALAGCKSGAPPKEYPLHGEIVRLDPQAQLATIKHDKIGDWMDAMTMEFRVPDAADFAKLQPKMKINGTVYVQDERYWLAKVQVIQ